MAVGILPRRDTNPEEDAGIAIGCGMAIRILCNQSGIMVNTIAAAKFNKGESLLAMALNHRAMSCILTTLGFQHGHTLHLRRKR